MIFLLIAVFFLSGAAGLVFETLWFRMAGLAFGNSVFASSVVLSSFMAGLALGNAIAARKGRRIARPLLVYSVLELLVGVFGVVLVLLFPLLPELLAPIWRAFANDALALNPLRFALAFGLLSIPTTAMGVTLPLMVKAMHRYRPDFGKALGWLYGANTIGAMTGAVLGEWLLIPRLGVTGSALAALALNVVAAAGALWLDRKRLGMEATRGLATLKAEGRPALLDARVARLLFAAALSGAILLALEVVWFRFLQLFVLSTTRGFAIMLLVVLLGIGAGGVATAWALRLSPRAYRLLPHLALVAGILTMASYFGFEGAPASAAGARTAAFTDTLVLSLRLMFPVSFASGLLFTFLGRAVFDFLKEDAGTVGWVTLSNTIGAASGAVLAGWILVPVVGIERSIFALALAYGALALLIPARSLLATESSGARLSAGLLGALYLGTCALFPFGLMRNHFVPLSTEGYRSEGTEIVEVREGLNETIVYLQDYWMGEPYSARLVTNSFSMTATGLRAERYMKYFAYWPLAFHPKVEKVLLISYGLGITARALTAASEIERIDVVDISRDIVDMSEYLYPNPEERPLHDPRVRLFIEDGRFFLLTSDERYDLITGEPPPLMIAGVVNLYTQEYFELIRERLAEDGYVTYWLPVVHLATSDALSIIRGFCNVFEDCSLWRGARLELVLVGSRDASRPVDATRFQRLWRDPEIARDLKTIGLETPGLLLATFVADPEFLNELTAGAAPLVDNYPYRLGPEMASRQEFERRVAFYIDWVRDTAVQKRYRDSDFLKELLPRELFESGLRAQPYQSLTELGLNSGARSLPAFLDPIDRLLTETELRTPALWLMGDHHEPSGVIESLAARGVFNQTVHYHLGLRELASRRFLAAEEHFRRAQELGGGDPEMYYYRVLALAYGGRLTKARDLTAELLNAVPDRRNDDGFWRFCERRFGLELPSPPMAEDAGR